MSGAIGAEVLAAGSAALAVLSLAEWGSRVFCQPNVEAATDRHTIGSALARLGASPIGRLLRPRGGSDSRGGEALGWPAEMVAGVRVLVGLVAALLLLAPTPLPVLALPIGALLVRVPAIAASRAARRRTRAASLELPMFLDLLSIATSAGLAPQLAVRRAVEPATGFLAAELGKALGAADLGGRWRDELEAATDRLELPDLRRAVALLRRTETYGASLGEEMQRLAADVRESRRSLAAERARAAPVKMLFPLVFLILPAFLLLTVVPVLLTTVRSIG